jgi:hypothetical protein
MDKDGNVFEVSEKETLLRFKRLVRYFINTPVRVCSGERLRKSGGVPSGSMFTNMIDSIVNMIAMRYCIYSTTDAFPLGEIYLCDWKRATVIPTHKGGDRSLVMNYRPVSLTSVVCKQMEHAIASYLRQVWDKNEWLYEGQH